MLAILYLLPYLACGLLMIRWLLPCQKPLTRIWLGLSFGLLLMMWLPALFAFAFRFSITAHLCALAGLGLLTGTAWLLRDKHAPASWDGEEKEFLRKVELVCLPLAVLTVWLQYSHVMWVDGAGNWNVGESTYGDLPMHLAFVTGLKNAPFPADYPFYPGHRLSYPFLTDSLSTTFYLFGMSLQAAVIIPAVLMMTLCFLGVLCLARRMTTDTRAVVIAALLFLINGGLGVLYDLDLAGGLTADGTPTLLSRLRTIFLGFYKTPTNQPDPNNLRWSNLIADLLVPQRTLMGGYCMVIPCFYLLWDTYDRRMQASVRESICQMLLLGIWAGALPLIHTHSFAAIGLCAAGLLVYDVCRSEAVWETRGMALMVFATAAVPIATAAVLHWVAPESHPQIMPEGIAERGIVAAGILLGLLVAGKLVYALITSPERRSVFLRYLVFGVTAVMLAAPQLFCFTFGQALSGEAQGSFLRIQFNWANNRDRQGMVDLYFMFYLKNIGLPFLALLLALLEKNRHHRRIFAGALAIILAAECIRFQPNEYDNNKLLYLAWMLCCIIVADWSVQVWDRMKGMRARPVIAVLTAAAVFLSGGLSIIRECIPYYAYYDEETRSVYGPHYSLQAFNASAVRAAEFIQNNTPEHSIFLSGTDSHLNPVDSIAGRWVVCGPDLWLYWHGFDTGQEKKDIRAFYENPEENLDVISRYHVDYVWCCWNERSQYAVDTDALDRMYARIYDEDGIVIWQVPEG